MTTTDARHLLDSKQVASFVARGFLRFDEIVPRALCEEALAEIAAGTRPSQLPGKARRACGALAGQAARRGLARQRRPRRDRPLAGDRRHHPEPGRTARDLRPPLRARHRAQPALEPALARRRDRRSAHGVRHPAVLLLPGHAARDGRHDDPARQPPAPRERVRRRALPELRRPDPDGVQRRHAAGLPPRPVALRPAQHHPDPPRDAEAAPQPQRAAAAALEHRRSRRRRDPRHPRQPRAVARQRGAPRGREPHQTVAAPDRRRALRRRLLAHAPGKPGECSTSDIRATPESSNQL